MRRKIWSGLLLVLSIIFGALFVESSDVSAFDFGNVNTVPVSGGWVNAYKGSATGDTYEREQYVSNINSYPILVSDSSLNYANNVYVNRINIDLGNYSIPANSLFNFTIRYDTNSRVNGLSVAAEDGGGRWVLLNKSCQIMHEIYGSATGTFATNDLFCTYWGYNSSSISSFLQMNARVYYPTDDNGRLWIPAQIMSVKINVSSGGSGSSGLTAEDRAFLSQQISTITSSVSNNTTALNQLKLLIQNQGESQQETLDNIQSAISEQNEQDQQDRDNIEQQSEDISDSADDSAGDAEQVGTTLLGAFSAFVTALTSASPSNCNIDMDLGNLDLGIVNLCTLSPPQPIPTIASIFLILFCVPLSIATARKVINLFRSFQ